MSTWRIGLFSTDLASNESMLTCVVDGYFGGVQSRKTMMKTDRMLDITIKIARVITKFPEVHQKLRFMEQRYGKECLCDSPSKLEKVIQGCGGSDSPSLGQALCDVLDGIVVGPSSYHHGRYRANHPGTRSIGSRPGRLAGSLRGWWPGVSAGRLRLSGW